MVDDSTRDIWGGAPDARLVAHRVDVVADIQATSQHGKPHDTALVRTTVELGDTLTTTVTEIPVFADTSGDDPQFTLTLQVPPSFAQLADSDAATFNVLVVLPRNGRTYSVELADYTRDYSPQVFDGADNPRIGDRIGVAWTGSGSIIEVIWNLVPPPR